MAELYLCYHSQVVGISFEGLQYTWESEKKNCITAMDTLFSMSSSAAYILKDRTAAKHTRFPNFKLCRYEHYCTLHVLKKPSAFPLVRWRISSLIRLDIVGSSKGGTSGVAWSTHSEEITHSS